MPHRPAIAFRPLTRDDAAVLFEWQNDPLSLAMSRSAESAEWQNHLRWIENALRTEDKTVLVAQAEGGLCGWVRFDFRGSHVELSWYVDTAFRGRGVGTEMVRAALERHGFALVIAEVHPDNAASIRIAENNGFTLKDRHDGFLVYEKTGIAGDPIQSPREG